MSGNGVPAGITAKYDIRGTLGAGAMGVVYDAWDRLIERRVAIKVVRRPTGNDPEAIEGHARFRREAQAAGRLQHPNIVAVYDYGEDETAAWIVMELVEGGSLKKVMDRNERLPIPEIVRVMSQVLEALDYSHKRGVVHRDIKPANVMLGEGGQVKLADFGIARIENSSMTQLGTVMGTPSYMAPEQLRGEPVDLRADIWASGVLLYQLLTGRKPFEGDFVALMHHALHTEPPPPTTFSVTCPRAFDAVIARALAKRPADRYPSAAAFAEAIRAAAAEPAASALPMADADATMVAARPAAPAPGVAAPAPTAAPPAQTPAGKGSAVPLVAGVVVAAALAGGVLVFGGFLGGGPGPQPTPPADATASPEPAPAPLLAQATPPAPTPAPAQQPAPQPTPGPGPQPAPPPAPAPQPAPPPAPAPPTLLPPALQPAPAPAPQPPPSPAPQPPPSPAPQPAPPPAPQPPPSPAPQPAPPPAPQPAPPPAPQPAPPPAPQPAPGPALQPAPAPAPQPAPPPQPAPGAALHSAPSPAPQPAPTPAPQPTPPPLLTPQPAPGASLLQRPVEPPQPQLALVVPRLDYRAAANAAVAAAPCGLIAAAANDSGLSLLGVVQRGQEAAVRAALSAGNIPAGDPAARVSLQAFDGPYCPALPLLRSVLAAPAEAPQVAVDGAMPLRRGDLLRFGVTMPPWPAHLYVAYFMKSGEVAHLVPSAQHPANARVRLGDPAPGFPGWEIDEPFGTDLMVVVASEQPLFPGRRPFLEAQDAYLAALSAALEGARRQGSRVLVRPVVIETVAR